MPLDIPTISSESDTIASELAGEIGESIPLKSVTRVLANALAGSIVSLYRFSGRRWLDMFARHASTESVTILGRTFIPLVELGNMLGVGNPNPAGRAELRIVVNVTTTGGAIAAGTLLTGETNRVTYIMKSSVPLTTSVVTATIVAVDDPSGGGGYGEVGNLATGAKVSFVAPLGNVERDCSVSYVAVAGEEAESWGSYRRRVHNARRVPPQGGAYTDYRMWATSVAGIEEAFPYAGAPGIVKIYVRATPASSGSEDGVATFDQRALVRDTINGAIGGLATKRPINAGILVYSITRREFDVSVQGLTITSATEARESIEAACDEYLRTREPFIVGLSALPRIDRITNADLSGVVSQVVASYGGTVVRTSLFSASEEVVAYTLAPGEHAKLGTIRWSI